MQWAVELAPNYLGVKFACYSDFCRVFWHLSEPLLLCNLWTGQFYVGLHERIAFASDHLFNRILSSNKYGADNILPLFGLCGTRAIIYCKLWNNLFKQIWSNVTFSDKVSASSSATRYSRIIKGSTEDDFLYVPCATSWAILILHHQWPIGIEFLWPRSFHTNSILFLRNRCQLFASHTFWHQPANSAGHE